VWPTPESRQPGGSSGLAWSTPVARSVEVATIYGEVQDKHLRTVSVVDMVEAGAAPQQQGRRDPTVAVSEHLGVARATAAAYVSSC